MKEIGLCSALLILSMNIICMITKVTLRREFLATFVTAESFRVMVLNMLDKVSFKAVVITTHWAMKEILRFCTRLITMLATFMKIELTFVICFILALITLNFLTTLLPAPGFLEQLDSSIQIQDNVTKLLERFEEDICIF